MAGDAWWCARCHHMLALDGKQYLHFSDDDWAGPGSECCCATDLVPCRPEAGAFRRVTAPLHALSTAVGWFSGTVSTAAGQWASLASAIAEPEEKQ